MAFFNSAIDVLKILVVAIGAGLAAWGGINLLEGYGNDNPGAKSQGIKHNMVRLMKACTNLLRRLRVRRTSARPLFTWLG